MLKIYFNNFKNPFIKSKITKIFNASLKKQFEKLPILNDLDFEVSLRYVKGDEIKSINKEYRQVDKETDVLSFPIIDFNNEEDLQNELKEKNASLMLGDIIICKQVAKKQAKLFKHSFSREVCFLALHGFLHLLGYDHIEKQDEVIMQSFAEEILNTFEISR